MLLCYNLIYPNLKADVMNKAIFILALGIFFVSTGCEKEKDNDDEGNRIEVDDEVYPISWGVWGSSDDYVYGHEGLYLINLVLLPSTMYPETQDSLTEIEGTGTLMLFLLVSSRQSLEGNYSVFSEGENETKTGQIFLAEIISMPSEDGYSIEEEGQLDITRSGDDYEISFIGVEDGGLTVNAYYKGILTYLN